MKHQTKRWGVKERKNKEKEQADQEQSRTTAGISSAETGSDGVLQENRKSRRADTGTDTRLVGSLAASSVRETPLSYLHHGLHAYCCHMDTIHR